MFHLFRINIILLHRYAAFDGQKLQALASSVRCLVLWHLRYSLLSVLTTQLASNIGQDILFES